MPSSKETGIQSVEELKQLGNECVKGANFSEAILHYSHALNQDPQNHLLYSNRSLAFLKLQQYYHAAEDAKQAIKLQPKWPKGYFRKGEVEFQVGHYSSALLSYGQALLLDPTNEEVKKAVSRTNTQLSKQIKKTVREPYIFCGVGAIVGLVIVLGDQFLTAKPSIQNTIIQVLLVIVFTSLGYVALKVYRYIHQSQIRSLLEPPVDLLEEMGVSKDKNAQNESDTVSSKQNETKPHRKGGVGAARQRYRKGKS